MMYTKNEKKSKLVLHKGDLLFYNGYLIYCEGKSGRYAWKFSCQFMPDFILTKSEIIAECRK